MINPTTTESALAQEDKVEVTRGLYDAIDRGDIPAVLELLDSEVEWRPPASVPWGGAFHGHEGFNEFLGRLGEQLEWFRLEQHEFFPVGDRVFVRLRLIGQPRGSDREFNVPDLHVWTVREGKIVELEAYFDTAVVLDALGLAEVLR